MPAWFGPNDQVTLFPRRGVNKKASFHDFLNYDNAKNSSYRFFYAFLRRRECQCLRRPSHKSLLESSVRRRVHEGLAVYQSGLHEKWKVYKKHVRESFEACGLRPSLHRQLHEKLMPAHLRSYGGGSMATT